MIGKTLDRILKEKGTNVNELAKNIGVSNQTLYSIIKRDNMKIDFELLLKICNELNVNIEKFYDDYIDSKSQQILLTDEEQQLILAYRANPSMQEAVKKLLDIDVSEKTIPTLVAARSSDNEPMQIKEIPDMSKLTPEDIDL
jgi:DNA-binding Xre family transcriptional regulator